MRRSASLLVLGILLLGLAASAAAQEVRVSWADIVGLIQPGNLVGSGTGQASLDLATGQARFKVDGLVLAGGNTIGTPGAITSVKGTFVCNAAGPGDSVLLDTPAVPLNAVGNARFNSESTPLVVPAECAAEPNDIAFLVRIVAEATPPNDRWIANGAVRRIQISDDGD